MAKGCSCKFLVGNLCALFDVGGGPIDIVWPFTESIFLRVVPGLDV